MSGDDRVTRWSTAVAVLGVAAVAVVASYEHAYVATTVCFGPTVAAWRGSTLPVG